MKLELITNTNIVREAVYNLDTWITISIFFFCMWAITLFLLVNKKHPIKYKKVKTREIKDWQQILRGYSILIFVWISYIAKKNVV